MECIMHKSGLNYYEPPKNYLSFLKMSIKKEGFSKRHIKDAVKSQELHHTLGFTTVKEVKWIIRSNQTQEFPVDIEDVENPKLIWGKDVTYLKGKTTQKKPIRSYEYEIRVTENFF